MKKRQSNEVAVAFIVLFFLFDSDARLKDLPNGFRKNMIEVVLIQGAAGKQSMTSCFDLCLHLNCQIGYDRIGKNDGSSAHIDGLLFLPKQIAFSSHEYLQSIWVIFHDLGQPLVERMIERFGINQGKAYEKDISIWKRKCPQSLVFILPSSIPQPELDEMILILDSGKVVVEDSRDIVTRKSIRGVADQKRCLADTSIANQHDLHRHRLLQ